MQSIVEVVCVGSGSNNSKTYNSVYNDPGYCKMVIVQDDDKFPSPRLCLLRRWPNFEGGFGFNLYEDLISQTGSLKVEEVVYNSPAEAGGLRKNDVIVEINGENIEFKSFFRLVEILKDACNQSEMELLVLAEPDAEWYRVRNICVNNNFPNIEYCETPYYGHILKPLESFVPSAESGGNTKTHSSTLSKSGNSQIEFHSSTGKLYRTTLVIDKEKDSVYRRIEELPSSVAPSQSADQITVPPLRPDGTYRHPSSEPSVRVYYRRDRECLNTQIENAKSDEINNATADSGHGSIRRSTPLSTATNTAANMNGMSPYSTLGKSYGEQAAVDLLHDKWADLMDKYLDNRFRSSSAQGHVASEEHHEHLNHRDASTGITLGRRNKYTIPLSDANPSMSSKKSRCQSPNDGSFSYLYSGRDDFQSASATSFREINRQSTSPYHHLAQQYQRGPQRYPSPHHSVASPTRHQQRPQSQNRYSNIIPDVVNTSASSSPLFQQYETSSYSTQTSHHKSTHESARHSPGHHGAHISSRSESSRAPHSIVLKTQKSQINSLGFQLNESDIVDKGCYFVKYVEPGSASALAGLKEGDKITKINGKSTVGMNYEQFCYEIVIAQQQQQKNNMIHLMVMRRSAKVNVHSSVATAASSSSNLSGPTVLPIKNSEQKNKSIISTSTSSNLVDEGYVPGSATSATSSATTNTANVSSNNLVSVVKVTAPSEVEQDVVRTHQSRPKTPPHKNTHNIVAEEPGYVAYESTVSYKPNVIYDNEEGETLRFLPGEENQLREQEQLERKQREREKLDREQEEREKLELIRLQREREEREREQEEQDRKERERERLENERHELERIEYLKLREQEQRDREREEREEREREEREHERIKRDREQQLQDKRDREEHERQLKEQEELDEELRRKELSLNNKDPLNVQSALTALTTITVIGSEPINAETYNVEVNDKPEHYQTYNVEASDKTERINYQAYNSDGVKPYHTATHRYPIIVDEIATTTTTKSVDEVERVREEEIFEQHQQPAPVEESNFEETEYQTTSQYLPEDLDVHQRHEDQADITQRDEEDRLQQQYAGIYSDGLVYNALRHLEKAEKEVFGDQIIKNIDKGNTKTYISNRGSLHYDTYQPETSSKIVSNEVSRLNNLKESSYGKYEYVNTDDSNYIQKLFVFKKSLNQEKLNLKREIMKSLNREDLDLEDLSSLSDISELASTLDEDNNPIDVSKLKFDQPFSIGFQLINKKNPLEVGNHLIEYVEPNSASDKAGVKSRSKIIKINEVGCEDKTHEFVMFYLNYVLRKADIETVELLIKEPFVLPSAANLTHKPHNPSYTRVQTLNEHFSDEENKYLKSIVRGILSSAQKTKITSNFNNTVDEPKSYKPSELQTSLYTGPKLPTHSREGSYQSKIKSYVEAPSVSVRTHSRENSYPSSTTRYVDTSAPVRSRTISRETSYPSSSEAPSVSIKSDSRDHSYPATIRYIDAPSEYVRSRTVSRENSYPPNYETPIVSPRSRTHSRENSYPTDYITKYVEVPSSSYTVNYEVPSTNSRNHSRKSSHRSIHAESPIVDVKSHSRESSYPSTTTRYVETPTVHVKTHSRENSYPSNIRYIEAPKSHVKTHSRENSYPSTITKYVESPKTVIKSHSRESSYPSVITKYVEAPTVHVKTHSRENSYPSNLRYVEAPTVAVRSRTHSRQNSYTSDYEIPAIRSKSHSRENSYPTNYITKYVEAPNSSYTLGYDVPISKSRAHSRENSYPSHEYILKSSPPSSSYTTISGKNENLKKIVLEATNYKPELLLPHTSSQRVWYTSSQSSSSEIVDNQNLKKIVLEATNYQPETLLPYHSREGRVVIKEIIRPKDYETTTFPSPKSSGSSYHSNIVVREPSGQFDNRYTSSSSNFHPSYRAEKIYIDESEHARRTSSPSSTNFFNKPLTSSPSVSSRFDRNSNVKTIVLEATDYKPTKMFNQNERMEVSSPSIYRRTYSDETREEQPNSSLVSALAALTQITALGSETDKSEHDLRLQGIQK